MNNTRIDEVVESLEQALAILQKRRQTHTGLGAPILLIKDALEKLNEPLKLFSPIEE